MRRPISIRTALPGIVIASVVALAGCAGSAYDAETARALQDRVAAVSTAAAGDDWAATETELMELETETQTALARGEITQARADAILAAVALVRTDVAAALEAERVAAEQAEAERVAAEEAARVAAEQAEAERVAAEEAARVAAEQAARDQQREDNGDKGKGKGKKDEDDD